ncbi:hypothetical protein [Clostridium cavendishii]|nr:hypothetical protein [Clostridium cavendishii]
MRYKEPLYGSYQDAGEDAYSIMKSEITNSEFVILGHSMGDGVLMNCIIG